MCSPMMTLTPTKTASKLCGRFTTLRSSSIEHRLDVFFALGGFSPCARRSRIQRRMALIEIRRFWPATFSPGSLPCGDACSTSAFISAPARMTSPESHHGCR
jgi:hypothetical protein